MNNNYLIILLNYNNWQDTVDCVRSLNRSDVRNSNILIIENCSTDNSKDKLHEEISDVKVIHSDKNLGFTGGNNVGIKYALENNYNYAIVLNNDTIIESKYSIRILIDGMEENPDVTIGTGRIFYFPQKDKIWYDGGKLINWRASVVHYNYRKKVNEIKLNDNLKEINFISGCYMCIRLKDISRLGYMDENFFIYLDDLEYSARAVKNNLKLMYFPQAIIYHKAMGEEKQSPKMVYYSMRNRKLLINRHFGITTKFYFEIVLMIKRIIWFFTNKKYYNLLRFAIRDYKQHYYGQAPEYIK